LGDRLAATPDPRARQAPGSHRGHRPEAFRYRRLRGIATPTSTTIEIEHINGCPACELDGIISDQGGSLSEVCTGDASAAES
jgi:hypothetical protein